MNTKKQGFSFIELTITLTIFSFVFFSALRIVGNVQFNQEKISTTQKFYDESRFLMERMIRMVRNNTIDYDRYCEENTACNAPYVDTFYVNGRNLGGVDSDGDAREDTIAFSGKQEVLYLINADRTLRIALKVEDGYVKVQQQLGVDVDNDGNIDNWSSDAVWNTSVSQCQIDFKQIKGEQSKSFCLQSYDWTILSPEQVKVVNSQIYPSPNKDPYLAFRDDSVQIQPHVVFRWHMLFREPDKFGFSENEVPEIRLQSSASSRVFGNTR